MNYAFVDYENVGTLDSPILKSEINWNDYSKIFVYIGAKQCSFTFPEEWDDLRNVDFIKIADCAKNNLDFHIALDLGRLDATVDKSIEFHILSQDYGYEGICKTLTKHGRIAKIALSPKNSPSPTAETLLKPAKANVPEQPIVTPRPYTAKYSEQTYLQLKAFLDKFLSDLSLDTNEERKLRFYDNFIGGLVKCNLAKEVNGEVVLDGVELPERGIIKTIANNQKPPVEPQKSANIERVTVPGNTNKPEPFIVADKSNTSASELKNVSKENVSDKVCDPTCHKEAFYSYLKIERHFLDMDNKPTKVDTLINTVRCFLRSFMSQEFTKEQAKVYTDYCLMMFKKEGLVQQENSKLQWSKLSQKLATYNEYCEFTKRKSNYPKTKLALGNNIVSVIKSVEKSERHKYIDYIYDQLIGDGKMSVSDNGTLIWHKNKF